MEKLFWIKEIFGSKLEIHQGSERVGAIRWHNMFSSKASADFNGRNFTLKRDFVNSKIEIRDARMDSLLSEVSVSLFNPRSEVVINGKRFELEIKNFWQSRWAWKFNGTEIIVFTSNEFITREKGDIELFTTCCEEVEILILLGLFVRNQFILLMLLLLIALLLIIV